MSAARQLAAAMRAADGLPELAGAEAVLEALGAEVTVVWGVEKPDAENRGKVQWLRSEGVRMHLCSPRTRLVLKRPATSSGRSWPVTR